jgi:hypothetical protein
LVVGVICAVGFPTQWVISTNVSHSRVMQSGYETCASKAYEKADLNAADFCREIWLENDLGYMGWGAWFPAVAWAAGTMIFIYALIWVVVWVVKWIWRGRRQNT